MNRIGRIEKQATPLFNVVVLCTGGAVFLSYLARYIREDNTHPRPIFYVAEVDRLRLRSLPPLGKAFSAYTDYVSKESGAQRRPPPSPQKRFQVNKLAAFSDVCCVLLCLPTHRRYILPR